MKLVTEKEVLISENAENVKEEESSLKCNKSDLECILSLKPIVPNVKVREKSLTPKIFAKNVEEKKSSMMSKL